MNSGRMYQVILGPHVSEKSVMLADNVKQQTFKVASNATKKDVKEAIEKLFDVDVIKMGWSDSEIYETVKLSRSNSSKMEFLTDCVVQGKTRELVEGNIKEAMFLNPHLIEEDLRQKMEKDIGLFITWIEKDDQVEEIDFPKGWSAGNTALHLACQSGAEEVYMCGFDGSSYSEPINNIYKGSKNYLPADSRGYNTINWDNQFKLVKRDFPNVKFIKVGTELTYEELKNNIR